MSKGDVFKAVLAALREELERKQRAGEAAYEGATDEEARSESKYDTRGLESSYLAAGMAQQLEDLAEDVHVLGGYVLPRYEGEDAVGLGALVEVDLGGEPTLFFLLPRGGGVEVDVAGREVTVVTTSSPIGAQLMGRKAGERFAVREGAAESEILAVQ
ncbi:MAG: transcription elongation factor GreAB [Verrucomicrobiota bacterium]